VADYGRALEFGIFPSPDATAFDQILAMARIADETGLDLIGVQDHPYQRRFLDTWMLMATILARTQRVRVFPDVANLPLRPPAMIAKAAASLDVMSGGRFELGLGAGAFWEAVQAMGGQRRSPGEAVSAVEEAIAVIRLMWSEERSVRYAGKHYRWLALNLVHSQRMPSVSGSVRAVRECSVYWAGKRTAGFLRARGRPRTSCLG
jgi:alkanesulfonate monooxygenase SsuD/methylene tetrahydromethanopterin reductase-like flavin-dependent oxidoreductase (luciferase family)